MTADVFQLLVNSSGAALVTGVFVYYLIKHDKKDMEREERFNIIIQDYLRESTGVKRDLAERMQKITDVLEYIESELTQRRKREPRRSPII